MARTEGLKIKTVEIQCLISGDDRPSYMIGGVRQTKGDRCRVELNVAKDLEYAKKARILPNSEKFETVQVPVDPPPRPKSWLPAGPTGLDI